MSSIFAQKINQYNSKNQRVGVWRKFYPNQAIRYEGQFENGKEVGVFKFYENDNSGYPSIIKRNSKSSDSVVVEFYSAKGWMQSKGKFLGKKRVGIWEYFFHDGKIMSKENYHNGQLHGDLINFYPNGKKTEHTLYTKGMKNGLSKTFSSDGVLIEEVTYVNDTLHGWAKYFELNGNLKEKGQFKQGKRFGKWEYYMDGEVLSEKEAKKKKRFKLKEN